MFGVCYIGFIRYKFWFIVRWFLVNFCGGSSYVGVVYDLMMLLVKFIWCDFFEVWCFFG